MKKIFWTLIFIAITLNSNPIDAKQLFNIEKVKVKKESYKESKEFYGITKLNESKTIDIVTPKYNVLGYTNVGTIEIVKPVIRELHK